MQDITNSFSASLQDWVLAKKLRSQDLRFLTLLAQTEQREKFCMVTDEFFRSSPTFSEGLQILETVVDLILMKKASEIPAYTDFQSWRHQLTKLRHPITSAHDDARKSAIEQLKWPHGSKIKIERRGDRHGVELKVFISSPTDLTKMIASLERVKDDFPV